MLALAGFHQRVLALAASDQAADELPGDGLQDQLVLLAADGQPGSGLDAQLLAQSGGNHDLAFRTNHGKNCIRVAYIISYVSNL